ncbi:ankyrin repeat domain-containing protein [Candidatus Dependentiae bacterium]|nr:ankyrin repeat domain-containing protein [Candidatus Dependentiae bacterium]
MIKKIFCLIIVFSFNLFATGDNSVFYACKDGKFSKVKQLVDSCIDINLKDKYGRTPLMLASYKGHRFIVSYLLQNGAKVNEVDNFGDSALTLASEGRYRMEESYRNIVQQLLKAGANIKQQNLANQTAFSYAQKNGHQKIVELLSNFAANI